MPVNSCFCQAPFVQIRSKYDMHMIAHYRECIETVLGGIVFEQLLLNNGSDFGNREPRRSGLGFVHYLLESSEPVSVELGEINILVRFSLSKKSCISILRNNRFRDRTSQSKSCKQSRSWRMNMRKVATIELSIIKRSHGRMRNTLLPAFARSKGGSSAN